MPVKRVQWVLLEPLELLELLVVTVVREFQDSLADRGPVVAQVLAVKQGLLGLMELTAKPDPSVTLVLTERKDLPDHRVPRAHAVHQANLVKMVCLVVLEYLVQLEDRAQEAPLVHKANVEFRVQMDHLAQKETVVTRDPPVQSVFKEKPALLDHVESRVAWDLRVIRDQWALMDQPDPEALVVKLENLAMTDVMASPEKMLKMGRLDHAAALVQLEIVVSPVHKDLLVLLVHQVKRVMLALWALRAPWVLPVCPVYQVKMEPPAFVVTKATVDVRALVVVLVSMANLDLVVRLAK